jgi:hypothetical protein
VVCAHCPGGVGEKEWEEQRNGWAKEWVGPRKGWGQGKGGAKNGQDKGMGNWAWPNNGRQGNGRGKEMDRTKEWTRQRNGKKKE